MSEGNTLSDAARATALTGPAPDRAPTLWQRASRIDPLVALNSTLLHEIYFASLGGDVSQFVPANVQVALQAKLGAPHRLTAIAAAA